MSDRSGDEYRRLQQVLDTTGATCDVSEAHGTLCSLVCLYGSRAGERWFEEILAPAAGDSGAAESEALTAMAGDTAQEFEDPASSFAPLLPGDSESMSIRAAALAHWSQGFLSGLGEAGVRPGLAARLGQEPLAELLRDLTEITRAVPDPGGSGEGDEQAFAELVEYVRVAAQLFYLELAPVRGDHHEAPGRLQ